jgi:hypothetical protein
MQYWQSPAGISPCGGGAINVTMLFRNYCAVPITAPPSICTAHNHAHLLATHATHPSSIDPYSREFVLCSCSPSTFGTLPTPGSTSRSRGAQAFSAAPIATASRSCDSVVAPVRTPTNPPTSARAAASASTAWSPQYKISCTSRSSRAWESQTLWVIVVRTADV